MRGRPARPPAVAEFSGVVSNFRIDDFPQISIDRSVSRYLLPRELEAADEVVRRVLARVPAMLELALLFGSKARRQARPESDVDVLLVFRRLRWDREPQAGMAEQIAGEVAVETGVPVATWTVSLIDLERGNRTPMLVDALADGVPLWPWDADPPRPPFTPWDAVTCAGALLQRVREGSDEAAGHLAAGRSGDAAKRARDDLVRLCTAALLLRGDTRPRKAGAVTAAADYPDLPVRDGDAALYGWAARSYGPTGKDADIPVAPPPGGMAAVAREICRLRAWVEREAGELARGLGLEVD
jgi:predicted nucleotidyltransferase